MYPGKNLVLLLSFALGAIIATRIEPSWLEEHIAKNAAVCLVDCDILGAFDQLCS